MISVSTNASNSNGTSSDSSSTPPPLDGMDAQSQRNPMSAMPTLSATSSGNNTSKYHFVRNFNQSSLAQYLKQSIMNSANDSFKNNAVFKWVQDLRLMSENECLCVLQAKSIVNKLNNQKNNQIEQQIHINNETCKKFVKNLENNNLIEIYELITSKKQSLYDEIASLERKIEKKIWQYLPNLLRKIHNNIQITINLYECLIKYCINMRFVKTFDLISEANFSEIQLDTSTLAVNKIQIKDYETRLVSNMNLAKNYFENSFSKTNPINTYTINNEFDAKFFIDLIAKIREIYEKYHYNFLAMVFQTQMIRILNKDSIHIIGNLLNQCLEICLKDELAKQIIIEQSGVIILFSTLKDSYFKNILDLILRTLSILCSHLESFKSLEKINCFEILTDILCDEMAQEWTRTEAAGCIAQITSPYLEFCDNLQGFFENMQDLIRALTVLCRDSSDIEIFLIGTAALANITFLDKMTCEYLNQFGTAQVLIENYYLKCYNSIFIKDQITTILANMALIENCRKEIAEFNGLNLLVEFLNEKPGNRSNNFGNLSDSPDLDNNISAADRSACERVQQKAAIAISRFCKEAKYASMLIDLGVINRISYICQNSYERNNSDSVLVACLAALRQLTITSELNNSDETHSRAAMNVSKEASSTISESNHPIFDSDELQKLMRPRAIKDSSFFLCSSAEESYV